VPPLEPSTAAAYRVAVVVVVTVGAVQLNVQLWVELADVWVISPLRRPPFPVPPTVRV
jgi:hypothetical protein